VRKPRIYGDLDNDKQVVIVSTSAAADALQAVLPSLAVLSWTGDKDKIDWTPLIRRRVVCWADKALPSMSDMAGVAAYIRVYGNPSMKLIKQPDDKPKGWGPLMMLQAGASATDIIAFCKANAVDLSFPSDLFAKISTEYRAKHATRPPPAIADYDPEPSIEDIEAELAAREG